MEHGAPRGVLVGRVAVVVLVVLLGPVGSVVARGAEPWSGPVEVPGAVAEGLMPLRFAATGTGVLAWTHAPFADPPVPELSASVVQGGLVESGVRLAAPFAAGGLVVYGNNRVVAVGTPGVPSASAPPQGLVVMRGRIGTPLRQTVPLVGRRFTAIFSVWRSMRMVSSPRSCRGVSRSGRVAVGGMGWRCTAGATVTRRVARASSRGGRSVRLLPSTLGATSCSPG